MGKARQEHNTAPASPQVLPEYRAWKDHWIRYLCLCQGLKSPVGRMTFSYTISQSVLFLFP